MKAIILAAGYATRLYPLTKDFPKPLLDVGGRTILDHLMEQIEKIAAINQILLVTNHRFFSRFERWRQDYSGKKPVVVLDDGTSSNDDRLGAVGDLGFVLQTIPVDDDLLITAADNILQFSLREFVAAFESRAAAHLCVHEVHDEARLRRTGIAVLDEKGRVIEFYEKPSQPKTRWAVPPLYLLPASNQHRIQEYLIQGGSQETPGHFIEWLHRCEPIWAYRLPGPILDIGTPESLEAARQLFASKSNSAKPLPQNARSALHPARNGNQSDDEYWRWCPRCGHELHNEKCKLRCPRCHYFMSCSDFD